MQYYDVFNGDADGLCALHQLRLIEPRAAELVTGPKREIDLLRRVPSEGVAAVTVLDVSLEKNAAALERLLAADVSVRYFDHHVPGTIPQHPKLQAQIDTRPDVCTSLLVDAYLNGQARAWAVVGAFGDNLEQAARQAAAALQLDAAALQALRELGICLNYNGYGATLADLHIAPDALYRRLQPYANPLDFLAEDSAFAQLREGYADDLARTQALRPEWADAQHRLFMLPAEPWARRASGVWANALAQAEPDMAHAILTQLSTGGYLVSVRAPLHRPVGADALCRQFTTGGGRSGAAGINHLPESDYARFVQAFQGF
jgi:hypothetical protein